MEQMETIRDTPFGSCIGRKIMDITTGDEGTEYANHVYFHLDNGETFFATIGTEKCPALMGFVDMNEEETNG